MTQEIKSGQIAAGAVGESELAASAVTGSKIAAGAVSSDKIAAGVISPYSNVRQTVQFGPMDTAGKPTFLPSSNPAARSITSQNISVGVPLVVSASNGYGQSSERLGTTTVNLTWSNLEASKTNYLYVDVNAAGVLTPGFTTEAPAYTHSTTVNSGAGKHTFVIPKMVMYSHNGSVASAVWRVFVGEAICDADKVTSAIAYAYNGYYHGQADGVATGASQLYSQTHNLGVRPEDVQLFFECTALDNPVVQGDTGYYALGDIITCGGISNYNYTAPPNILSNTKTSKFWGYDINANYADRSSYFWLGDGNWKLFMICKRGW